MDDMRQEFEAYIGHPGALIRLPVTNQGVFSGSYEREDIQIQWGTWQAACASQQAEIERLTADLAGAEKRLKVEELFRVNNLQQPATGHDYWERWFKARLTTELSEVKAQRDKLLNALNVGKTYLDGKYQLSLPEIIAIVDSAIETTKDKP